MQSLLERLGELDQRRDATVDRSAVPLLPRMSRQSRESVTYLATLATKTEYASSPTACQATQRRRRERRGCIPVSGSTRGLPSSGWCIRCRESVGRARFRARFRSSNNRSQLPAPRRPVAAWEPAARSAGRRHGWRSRLRAVRLRWTESLDGPLVRLTFAGESLYITFIYGMGWQSTTSSKDAPDSSGTSATQARTGTSTGLQMVRPRRSSSTIRSLLALTYSTREKNAASMHWGERTPSGICLSRSLSVKTSFASSRHAI